MGALTTILGLLAEPIKAAISGLTKWSERRDALKAAESEAKIAEARARAELAGYRVKAETEWDLTWADGAKSSWKDEYLLLLWSLPLIGLFIPGVADYVMQGFEYLKTFSEDALTWYISGWAIIFAATFGLKSALKVMLPGRIANLVSSMDAAAEDIPEAAAAKANEAARAIIRSAPTPTYKPAPSKTQQPAHNPLTERAEHPSL